MTEVPLGRGAYKRLYAGSPEVKLVNRWLEANPANLREGVSVLARPGTSPQGFFDPGDFSTLGPMRGNFTLSGLFDDSLFVVSGQNLYRINQDLSIITIEGVINGTGTPEVAWQKGIGFERLWIADGTLLQFYAGTSAGHGTLTDSGTIVDGTDKFEVNGTFYAWGTTFSPGDVGSSSNPFIVNPTTTDSILDPMNQLVLAIMNSGIAGEDYSSTITTQNPFIMATSDGLNPAITVTITATAVGTVGNTYTFTVVGGTALTASGTGTLVGGGVDALEGCTIPTGGAANSLAEVSSYILVSVANTQQFYFINPGEVVIDPLNFASKESSPDNITTLRTVGDQVLIMGEKSTENWYATGNLAAPFAPIEGRVYARGAITGTPVVVDQGVFLVGDDGRAYSIGFQYGDATDAGFGVTRVSNNGIEERIRRQLRREAGFNP
jgi:hypothetical protein